MGRPLGSKNGSSSKVQMSCPSCGKVVSVYPYRVRLTEKIFCSPACSSRLNRNFLGHTHSQESKTKMSQRRIGIKLPESTRLKLVGRRLSPLSEFKKGMTPWNKGLKGYQAGEKNSGWKGEKAGDKAFHAWVARYRGKPNLCEHCGTTSGLFDWANKSHEYKRDLSDWLRLCKKCHKRYDAGFKGALKQKFGK